MGSNQDSSYYNVTRNDGKLESKSNLILIDQIGKYDCGSREEEETEAEKGSCCPQAVYEGNNAIRSANAVGENLEDDKSKISSNFKFSSTNEAEEQDVDKIVSLEM